MSPRALQEFRERLMVALEAPLASAAQRVVQHLGESVSTYKVGLQLFTAEGPAVVRELVAAGRTVFLDLKIHDIPNTVAHAVKSAVDSGAKMLTVHATGGGPGRRASTKSPQQTTTLPSPDHHYN